MNEQSERAFTMVAADDAMYDIARQVVNDAPSLAEAADALRQLFFEEWGESQVRVDWYGITLRFVDAEHDAYPDELPTFASPCVACGGTVVSPRESEREWFYECVMCGFDFTLPREPLQVLIGPDTPWTPGCDGCGEPLYLVQIDPGEVVVLECRSCGRVHRLPKRPQG